MRRCTFTTSRNTLPLHRQQRLIDLYDPNDEIHVSQTHFVISIFIFENVDLRRSETRICDVYSQSLLHQRTHTESHLAVSAISERSEEIHRIDLTLRI